MSGSGILGRALFPCTFFIFYYAAILARASRHDCTESPLCNESSYYNYQYSKIEFPFRLRGVQPEHCGYPGFDLSCNSKNETVLNLPNIPINFIVASKDTYIYYSQHEILVGVPAYYDSIQVRRSLELLNLSTTPFRFTYKFTRLTLLNCPGNDPSFYYNYYQYLCHRHSHHYKHSSSYVRAVISKSSIVVNSNLINCTKLYDYYAPVDLHDDYDSYKYVGNDHMAFFSLTWSIPSCKRCFRMSKQCRMKKNGAANETECFNEYYYHTEGPIKSILVKAGSIIGSILILAVVIGTYYIHSSDKKERENQMRIKKFLEDYMEFNPSRYTYSDIKKITDQFKNMLGQGAYGTVFKGKLSNDIYVAVKILNNITKRNGEEFINEVATMGRIHHVNVVRLVGFCADGFKRALVYEFLPNGSLDKYISSKPIATNHSLSWEKLHEIALGVAKGIEYLHQGCDQRILHFDIKPHNILLDHNFSPKIADFGLAKLCSKDQSIVSMTTARGTMGYIAPEVFSRNFGNVSYKSDVYSFGMLLLEMVGGRKNTSAEEPNNDEIYYPEWIYNLLEEGEDLRIQIEEEEDAKIAKKLAIVGLWCIQWHPAGRPTMKVAVRMLEGRDELSMPPNPFASSGPSSTISKRPARLSPLELEAIAE